MEKAPQISVIIPVYNTENYLNQCVDSVLNQSYQDFEIILVDDGSKDSCGTICDDYSTQDKRIITIHKQNGGQSSARNAALDIANGKYIYFLDSDDYIGSELLNNLIIVAEQNNADFVFFEAETILEDKYELYKNIQKHFDYKRKNSYPICNAIEQYIRLNTNKEYYVCTPLHFYKKDYLNNNKIRFKEGIVHEDNLFSTKVYLCDGVAVHLSSDDYKRRLHTQSTVTKSTSDSLLFKFLSLVTVYKETSALIEEFNPKKQIISYSVNNSISDVLQAYKWISSRDKRKRCFTLWRIKNHALFHYGKYDYQLARKCAGTITKPFIRCIHFLYLLVKRT